MVTILMMSAEMATLGILKIKVFRNNVYDAIIFVYDVINKKIYCRCGHVTKVW